MGPLRVKRSGAPAPAHLVKTERRSRSRSFGENGAALPLPLIRWKGSGAPAPAHSVKRERRSRSRSFGEKGAALPLPLIWWKGSGAPAPAQMSALLFALLYKKYVLQLQYIIFKIPWAVLSGD